MLVYVEYFSRRPGVALNTFHEVAGRGQRQWEAEYGAVYVDVGREIL